MKTRKKIIIAEDNIATLRLQERIIQRFPIDIEKFSRGEALHRRLVSFDSINPDFDGLITDDDLGNGYFGSNIALNLREKGFKGYLRVQSGHYYHRLVEKLGKNGIDFVAKPFQIDEYKRYLNRFL